MAAEYITTLLVEDNPDDADLIRELLAEVAGDRLQIEWVERLSESLERIPSGGIDAILLDLSLPDSQGLNTLTRMLGGADDLPIVVLTGLDDEQLGLEAVERGAQDYLFKGAVDGFLLVRSLRYAIERKRTEGALRESERFIRSTLNGLAAHIAIVDEEGNILAVNQAWRYFAEVNPPTASNVCEGANYLDVCDAVVGDSSEEAAEFAAAIRAVLTGEKRTFSMEYPCHSPTNKRWFIGRVTRFPGDGPPRVVVAHENITERKQAEQALRESERKLSTLMSNLPGIAYRCRNDRQWTMEFTSQGCINLTGYKPDDLLHNRTVSWIDLIHPDDRQMVWDSTQVAIHEDQPFQLSYRIITRTGAEKWVWVQGCAVRLSDESIYLEGFIADITDLKRAQEAEREQRTLTEALVDVSAKLNSTLDFEEVLEHILANVEQVAPYDSANIMLIEDGIARVVRQKGRGEDTEKLVWMIAETPILSRMVEKNEPVAILDTQTAPLWVENIPWIRSYAGAPIRLNEEVIGFINLNGAKPDMFTAEQAQRLQAFANQTAIAIANARLYHELEVYSGILEQAVEERTAELQQTKERVETILNYSPDPILLLKPDGVIETANPAFKEVFGYHIDDVFRQPPTRLIVDEQADMIKNALQNAITKRMVTRLELVALRQDGTTFDADVALAPIREDADLLGIVCNVRDISALKEVERMKDSFVSNVSHELRTPITSLKLSHRLLEMDPAGREKYMGRLGREINRLNALIEDLLRLSRLDQGRVELKLQPVDINELAQQYVNDRTPLAESQGLTLLFEGDLDLSPAQADEGLIGQVLSILLTNALNYTPAGGRVTVSTLIESLNGKQWVGFSVSDNGPGITPDDLSHLFERFYRGKAGHNSGAPGTGLGLAIAQEIVERHHGRIAIQSEGVPGQGSRFTVRLPIHIP